MQFRGNSCFDSRTMTQAVGHPRLIARPRIDSRPVHVKFVVDAVENGSGFSFRVLQVSPINIITPVFHTHSHFHINTLVIRRTSGRSLENFTNIVPSRGRRSSEEKNTVTLYSFRQLCRRFDIGAVVT
jgi:hypothetical protein